MIAAASTRAVGVGNDVESRVAQIRMDPTATISVCIPARDEAPTIGPIVQGLRQLLDRGLIDELVVLDDDSTDATASIAAAAGARVVRSSTVCPHLGATRGKGDVLWRSLHASTGSVVVWCDADLEYFDPQWALRLAEPILSDDRCHLAKATYRRAAEGTSGGGRVTELLARPLLALLWPELAWLRQPLGGEYAGRRAVLEQQWFECDYGVEIGLVLDIAAAYGPDSLTEVDLGERFHRHRPLDQLHHQATSVASAMLRRSELDVAVPAGGRALAFGERVPAIKRPPIRHPGPQCVQVTASASLGSASSSTHRARR